MAATEKFREAVELALPLDLMLAPRGWKEPKPYTWEDCNEVELLVFAPRVFNPKSPTAVARALRFSVSSPHVHPDFKPVIWPACPEAPRRRPMAVVESVKANSPAEKASIRTGDLILNFNGLDCDDVPSEFDYSAVSSLLAAEVGEEASHKEGIVLELGRLRGGTSDARGDVVSRRVAVELEAKATPPATLESLTGIVISRSRPPKVDTRNGWDNRKVRRARAQCRACPGARPVLLNSIVVFTPSSPRLCTPPASPPPPFPSPARTPPSPSTSPAAVGSATARPPPPPTSVA